MNIVHLSFSTSGGAGNVAKLISEGDRLNGHKSRLISATDANLLNKPLDAPFAAMTAGLDNFVLRNKSFGHMFSITRGQIGQLSQKTLEGVDLVFAHWTPGLASLRNLERIASRQKLALVLHDTYFFSGGCHYPGACKGYETGCNDCPGVRPNGLLKKHISTLTSQKARIAKLAAVVVSPSAWIRDRFLDSEVGQGCADKARVATNPIRDEFHASKTANRKNGQFIVVATDLSNPTKRVAEIVKTFLKRGKTDETLLLVGMNGDAFVKFDPNRIKVLPHALAGELAALYSEASFNLSFADQEVFGLTIAEAAACGTPTIGIVGSGAAEVIRASKSGIVLTQYRDFESARLPDIESSEYLSLSAHGKEWSKALTKVNTSRLWLEACH